MNFKFSMAHNNLVAETTWFGDLDYETIVDGIVRQNQWIIENSDKLPLVLVSDYTSASLNHVTAADLKKIEEQFKGAANLFPDMAWIAILPAGVKYDTVRLWLEHAESLFKDSYVVNSLSKTKSIITEILMRHQK